MEATKKSERSLKIIRIIIVVNSITILFGIVALIGWISGVDELASVESRYIPMSRDTALFFILLSSISILILRKKTKTMSKLFRVIALFIAIYGTFKFAEYFIHFDLTFEDVWLPVSDETGLWPVKRMSPYTGLLYLFSGVAIFLSIKKNTTTAKGNVSTILGVLVLLFSFVAFTGYLFDSPLLYGSETIPIAANTAAAFMFLSFSIILSTQNSYVADYVSKNEIFKTLIFAFIPVTTILIFVITLLTKVMLQDNRTNIGLVTSLVFLVALFVVILIIIPVSRRITQKIDRANENLLESFDRLDRSQKISVVGSWELDLETNLMWGSQEAFNIYELSRESEFIDSSIIRSMASNVDNEILDKTLVNLIKNGETYDVKFTIKIGTKKKCIHSKASITKDSLGKPIKVLGVIRDITEEVNNQKEINALAYELKQSHALLRSSINSQKNTIMISLDTNYKYLYFNEPHKFGMKEIYGVEIDTGVCIFNYMSSQDDINRAKEKYDRTLLGESHKSLEQYGDLVVNYYESSYSPIINDVDEIVGISIFTENVTDRIEISKRIEASERKLQIAEALLRGSIDSQLYIPIFSLDTNYKYLLFNEAHSIGMKELYGVSIEIGKCIFDYISPKEDIPKVKENYKIALSGTRHKKTEQYGELVKHFYEANYSPIIDKSDEIIGVSVFTEDITDRINREKEIEFLSFHDSLTGLYNRRFFEDQLKRLNNPRNLPLSIIMGDVNGLKLINDAFGHQAGDELLKMIGDIISKSIRGNDIAARWGGDEFAILLPNSGTDAAEVLINRIQKKIKKASFEYGKISISFGLETKNHKDEKINEIFASAEEFMYQNKLIEIDSIRGQTINTIMTALFEKSNEVKEHSERVSELSASIAEKMGLSKVNANDIKTMGLIHDIGKIVIDLQILDKPNKLTDEERKIIEQHPLSGSRMLNSSHEYSRLSAGVLHHHERIDGKGYPNGITGEQIPIESKIIAVADAFDAMTAERPYRLNPLSMEEAIAELKKHSGTQFDKDIVDVFVNMVLK